ncbi:MAG: nicotinic acid mononucleotide adenylyltransferase [Candidatus Marinimicrobia bacterium]|nr:nicotinic acid mononucleotide adenylyltransferase [Candidatus Neomarinimicrobiota bacterium]|tara:strand:- start:2124 stop:2702 length:579 start_codon:yes stop_codon:yes gene_type:complete
MRICLFGGTFDPPHIGHLLIAQTVCEAENFDKILFVPANKPPHKNTITKVDHRLAMLNLAVKENPNFEISDVEIQRGGLSYTIDTLKEVRNNIINDEDELFYLIGSDSLLEFKNWKKPREILKESQVVVAIRPGFRPSDIPAWILHKIRFANIPRFEISSSNIRERWIENKTIRYLVTLPVWEYINKHRLYN